MNYILRGFRAEYLKTHRTPIYWLLLLCPLALNVLVFLIIGSDDEGKFIKEGTNPWMVLYSFNYLLLSGLFIILFVAMMTSLINNIEHKGNSWKHLYALSQPRWVVYFNKSVFSLTLLLATLLFFSLVQIPSGVLLSNFHPKFQSSPMILLHNVTLLAKTFMATLGIWSIHHWLTFRYRNFALSVGIGIVMLTFVAIGKNFLPWIKYLPYALPGEVIHSDPRKMTSVSMFTQEVWLGLGWGLIIWLGGFWDAKRRDII